MSECVSRFLTALGQWCAHQGHLTIISTESTNPPNRTPATSFAVCLPHVGALKFCSCPEVLARPTLVGARPYRPGRGSLPQLQPIAKLARPSDHACNHLCITDLRCPKTARHTTLRAGLPTGHSRRCHSERAPHGHRLSNAQKINSLPGQQVGIERTARGQQRQLAHYPNSRNRTIPNLQNPARRSMPSLRNLGLKSEPLPNQLGIRALSLPTHPAQINRDHLQGATSPQFSRLQEVRSTTRNGSENF